MSEPSMIGQAIRPTMNFRWLARAERENLLGAPVWAMVKTLQQMFIGEFGTEWRDVPTEVDESVRFIDLVQQNTP